MNTKKATSINLFSLKTPHMRTFHLAWFSFFLCFFGWFGIAPLMAVVRDELGLDKAQIGNIIISSVAITVFARLAIGWLCDKFGPRITYSVLLILGAFPVMLIGLSNSYESFLLFRLAIGVIGASFVITQYHTSMMFAPNVVGTANATTAGWGNLGGGVTQMVMPMVFAGFVALGFLDAEAWRYAMVVPGVAMVITGVLYYKFTQDFPEGNIADLKKTNPEYFKKNKSQKGGYLDVVKDTRVWALAGIYAACFGIELTINNIAAIYYHDYFQLDLKTAGIIAGLFGVLNFFARPLGGAISDKVGIEWGLKGRVALLGGVLMLGGLSLVLFAQMDALTVAIASMVLFGLLLQMSSGATFSVVPFINKKAVGAVAGIVGAGGNAGAVLAGFLFKVENISYQEALYILGFIVAGVSGLAMLVRFSAKDEREAQVEMEASLTSKNYKRKPVLVN